MSGGKKAIPDLSHLVRYRHNPELQRATIGGGLGGLGLGASLQLPGPLSGIGGLGGQPTLEQQLALQQQLNQQYQQASMLAVCSLLGLLGPTQRARVYSTCSKSLKCGSSSYYLPRGSNNNSSNNLPIRLTSF